MTTTSRIALVTGATQGLGRALVDGLAHRLGPTDTVYVTGRNGDTVNRIAAELDDPQGSGARVRGEFFDVGQPDEAARLAETLRERHGGVDIVYGNAVMRIDPGDEDRKIIHDYVETNNLGTTRLLRAFLPVLRDGGRLVVVASNLGRLAFLAPVLHPRFGGLTSLDAVDDVMTGWRDIVADGSVRTTPWPSFVNIVSKIGQVAAVRVAAEDRRHSDEQRDILLAAVCPGMMNTPTSRAWWDVSDAPSPEQAAVPLIELVMGPAHREFYGELVRDGKVLPWS